MGRSIDDRPRIEYAQPVIRTIRNLALEALLPQDGLETAGVLFGTVERGCVKVLDFRPIHCEHSQGLRFALSERDRVGMVALLDSPRDAGLLGLQPVGWYRTHARSGWHLSAEDLELHNRFFPERHQFAMLLRSAELPPIRVGMFARDDNRSLGSEFSCHELTIDSTQPERPA